MAVQWTALGGGSEGGGTVKSTCKSTVTKVEPTAKGAVYHVESLSMVG